MYSFFQAFSIPKLISAIYYLTIFSKTIYRYIQHILYKMQHLLRYTMLKDRHDNKSHHSRIALSALAYSDYKIEKVRIFVFCFYSDSRPSQHFKIILLIYLSPSARRKICQISRDRVQYLIYSLNYFSAGFSPRPLKNQ